MQEDKNDKPYSEYQTSTDESTDLKSEIEIKDKEELKPDSKAKLQEDTDTGFFHVTRRYKWIFSFMLSITMCLARNIGRWQFGASVRCYHSMQSSKNQWQQWY